MAKHKPIVCILQQTCRMLVVLLAGGLLGACGSEEEGVSAGAASASLPQVRTRVATAIAEPVRLSLDQDYTGVVTPFRKAQVAAEVGGRVVERLVEPGDQVRSGDVLIQLDPSRAQIARDRAKSDLAAREVELTDAARNLDRGERLQATGAISELELDALTLSVERARAGLGIAEAALREALKNLEDASIEAPFHGRIEAVLVQVGDYLAPGQKIGMLNDFSKARVHIGVTAGEAASLVPGQSVRLGMEAVHTGVAAGVIRSVGRSATEQGVFPVEVWMEGEDAAKLREGMVISVALDLARRQPQVVVPTSAVFRRDGMTQVFVVDGQGRARLIPVSTGLSSSGRVEVVSGLEAGDEVITDGQFALGDGALVEVTRARL